MKFKEIKPGEELNEDCIVCKWFIENDDTGNECKGCGKDYVCSEWRGRNEV